MPTVSDVIAYLDKYVPDKQTIVVLHSDETVEHDGAIAMEVVLDDIESDTTGHNQANAEADGVA